MLEWKDGQPYSNRYGDVYHCADSGMEEPRHVFLRGNRLAERFALLSEGQSFCIAETGFGTGLHFLCASQLFGQVALDGTTLDFFSVEKFPLSDDDLRATLAQWGELRAPAAVLLARWRRRVPGWNRWSLAGGRVRLTLALCDVAEALPQLPASSVDAWFLDGFAPAKNPEMWSDAVLRSVARACGDGATFASYTSAGWVRRGLQQAGFSVQRTPGFGRKREMVCYALSAKRFSPFAHFPLTPVRGQITAVPATAASRALQAVVCGDGYCAPAADGAHVIGATHAFGDEADDLRMTDHAENLARLAAYAPALHRALGDVNAEHLTGRASVRCSAPGAMPLVGMVQEGLHCSLGHGTRGLITAGLAGELLAAQICGQLPPLPEAILSALAPVPRLPGRRQATESG